MEECKLLHSACLYVSLLNFKTTHQTW